MLADTNKLRLQIAIPKFRALSTPRLDVTKQEFAISTVCLWLSRLLLACNPSIDSKRERQRSGNWPINPDTGKASQKGKSAA